MYPRLGLLLIVSAGIFVAWVAVAASGSRDWRGRAGCRAQTVGGAPRTAAGNSVFAVSRPGRGRAARFPARPAVAVLPRAPVEETSTWSRSTRSSEPRGASARRSSPSCRPFRPTTGIFPTPRCGGSARPPTSRPRSSPAWPPSTTSSGTSRWASTSSGCAKALPVTCWAPPRWGTRFGAALGMTDGGDTDPSRTVHDRACRLHRILQPRAGHDDRREDLRPRQRPVRQRRGPRLSRSQARRPRERQRQARPERVAPRRPRPGVSRAPG